MCTFMFVFALCVCLHLCVRVCVFSLLVMSKLHVLRQTEREAPCIVKNRDEASIKQTGGGGEQEGRWRGEQRGAGEEVEGSRGEVEGRWRGAGEVEG